MATWMTFAVMIAIQIAAAAALVSRINYIVKDHAAEIKSLREWRHDFGQKEMVYDEYKEDIEKLGDRVGLNEARVASLDGRVGALERRTR
jgi:hypothetical protein